MPTIAVLGTFDTKGHELDFLARCIRRLGLETRLIDISTAGLPQVKVDTPASDVLGLLGQPLEAPSTKALDRGAAIELMSQAIPRYLCSLHGSEQIQGVIALGGSGGTALATAGMRALPLGLPKVMVSTMASGNVAQYVDVSDIVMVPSVVDISGLNRISRAVFQRAAAMVVALVRSAAESSLPDVYSDTSASSRPLVVASMFGNTTRCVEHARKLLEQAGYEVLVFHATGIGGRTMESIIASGAVAGVLDITTTEWADELVGGVMPGGPQRLEAAAKLGVPAVIAPGCLDMVNFGAPESVPAKFAGRRFYRHNPQVTLMRTNEDECRQIGSTIGAKLANSVGPYEVLFPLRAISVISAPGQPFHDPAADTALLQAWAEQMPNGKTIIELDCDINSPEFAQACVTRLLAMLT